MPAARPTPAGFRIFLTTRPTSGSNSNAVSHARGLDSQTVIDPERLFTARHLAPTLSPMRQPSGRPLGRRGLRVRREASLASVGHAHARSRGRPPHGPNTRGRPRALAVPPELPRSPGSEVPNLKPLDRTDVGSEATLRDASHRRQNALPVTECRVHLGKTQQRHAWHAERHRYIDFGNRRLDWHLAIARQSTQRPCPQRRDVARPPLQLSGIQHFDDPAIARISGSATRFLAGVNEHVQRFSCRVVFHSFGALRRNTPRVARRSFGSSTARAFAAAPSAQPMRPPSRKDAPTTYPRCGGRGVRSTGSFQRARTPATSAQAAAR